MALRGKAAMFLVDIQTAFRDNVSCFSQVLEAAKRLTNAASILELPLIVTEQYPKGLGHTLEEIDTTRAQIFEKTTFSGFTPEVKDHLKDVCVSDIVLFGLEAHICVQQTCLDLINEGYKVHVIADATTSRSHGDRMAAFQSIRQAGGYVTTFESILFSILGSSKHPKFREVQKLVIDPLPDQGMYPKL